MTLETIEPTSLIFLGTGTSSSLPHVECLTAGPNDPQCKCCLSTLHIEGKRNIRRNTSAVVRMPDKDGRLITILIDCGKNFQAAALEWFPKYGLRRIDALLITHAHADAMNGLDDLRAWTLEKAIQPHIDVYASEETYIGVQRSFPYLVNKEFASGGGDVPEFKWHIISDQVPFEIQDTGVHVTPIAVHHGRIFSANPPLGSLPTPNATLPSTPTGSSYLSASTRVLFDEPPVETKIFPYICMGFKIQDRFMTDQLVYLGDVSNIPEEAWAILEEPLKTGKQLPVLVLDCLRLRPHTSHLGMKESVAAARRIGAKRTYQTGFTHDLTHEEYVTIGEVLGGKAHAGALTENERNGLELAGEGAPLWLRPAHDGLRAFISQPGMVQDESYD